MDGAGLQVAFTGAQRNGRSHVTMEIRLEKKKYLYVYIGIYVYTNIYGRLPPHKKEVECIYIYWLYVDIAPGSGSSTF